MQKNVIRLHQQKLHLRCVNGLLMLEADIAEKSPMLSLYGYEAYDADILDVYRYTLYRYTLKVRN